MTDDARTDPGRSRDPEGTGGVAAHRRRRRGLLAAGGVVVAGLLAWLAFGYFGVQAIVLDDEVDQAGPVFDSGAGAASTGRKSLA